MKPFIIISILFTLVVCRGAEKGVSAIKLVITL